jgi:hypothetical protein
MQQEMKLYNFCRNSLLVLSGSLVLKSVDDRSVVLGDCGTKFGSDCAVTLHRALQYTTHRSVPPLRVLGRRLRFHSVTQQWVPVFS